MSIIKVKTVAYVLLLGFFLTLDLNAYTLTITANGTYNLSTLSPSWQQTSVRGRVDTIIIIRERANPADVWGLFCGTTLMMTHAVHSMSTTWVDSVNIFFGGKVCY